MTDCHPKHHLTYTRILLPLHLYLKLGPVTHKIKIMGQGLGCHWPLFIDYLSSLISNVLVEEGHHWCRLRVN